MTSFLRLNGISVPVAARTTPSASQDTIGKFRRSANAFGVVPRRARKGVWKFATTPLDSATARCWRELLAGAGHVLSFDASSYYTSKGMAPVAVGANWTFIAAGPTPKFGSHCLLSDSTLGGSAVTWAFFPTSAVQDLTLAWYAYSGGLWHHYVQLGTGGGGLYWIDGVSVAPGTTMVGLNSITAGVASFGAGVGASIAFDDVVALPYRVPTNWPAQMFAWGFAGNAFSLLPSLTADGSYIEQNVATTVIGGDASGAIVHADPSDLTDFAFERFER